MCENGMEIVFWTIFLQLALSRFKAFCNNVLKKKNTIAIIQDGAELSSDFSTTTQYLEFPIFSLCKIPSDDDRWDRLVVSGGGGGSEYGIADRLEVYGRKPKRTLDLIASQVTLGVVDSLCTCRPKNNFFFGCTHKDCVVWKINSKGTVDLIAKWNAASIGCLGENELVIQERCAVNSDGSLIALMGVDGCLRIFEYFITSLEPSNTSDNESTFRARLLYTFSKVHASGTRVTDMSFSPDGNLIVVACRDGKCHIIGPFCPSLLHGNSSQKERPNILHTVQLLLPDNLYIPSNIKHRPDHVTPRSIVWVRTFSDSTPHRGRYLLCMTGYAAQTSIIFKIELYTSIPLPADQGEITIDWRQLDYRMEQNVPMFNCIALSSDRSKVAVVSNTHLFLYSIELKRLLKVPRCAGECSDMPATGCCFMHQDTEIAIGAGDFGLTVVSLSKATNQKFSKLCVFHIIKFFIYIFLYLLIALCLTTIFINFRLGFINKSNNNIHSIMFNKSLKVDTKINTMNNLSDTLITSTPSGVILTGADPSKTTLIHDEF